MSDFNFIDFLELIEEGLSTQEAIARLAYEYGLITEQEIHNVVTMFSNSMASFNKIPKWEIPEDPFEKVVYVTAWTEWLHINIWKVMHNAMTLSAMKQRRLGEDVQDAYQFDFPLNPKELSLQWQLQEILKSQKGEPQFCTLRMRKKSRKGVFVLQCLLGMSEEQVVNRLCSKQPWGFQLEHAHKLKLFTLSKFLREVGVDLSFE